VVKAEGNPPRFTVPIVRLALLVMQPSSLEPGVHPAVFGKALRWTRVVEAAEGAAMRARVAAPGARPPLAIVRIADISPLDCTRLPEHDRPSVSAVAVGGGQTFPPEAAVVLAVFAVASGTVKLIVLSLALELSAPDAQRTSVGHSYPS
jgi:hypothetical protein